MEPAKSGRSKCEVSNRREKLKKKLIDAKVKSDSDKTSKAQVCKAASELIPKGAIRVGSLCAQSGSYTRWVHLDCWRVPSKIWMRLTQCTTPAQVELALVAANDVLLSGFVDLAQEAKALVIAHVMVKENWAKVASQAKATVAEDTTSSLKRPPTARDPLGEAMAKKPKLKAKGGPLRVLSPSTVETRDALHATHALVQAAAPSTSLAVQKERFVVPKPGDMSYQLAICNVQP
jgi:hypothetical protein